MLVELKRLIILVKKHFYLAFEDNPNIFSCKAMKQSVDDAWLTFHGTYKYGDISFP